MHSIGILTQYSLEWKNSFYKIIITGSVRSCQFDVLCSQWWKFNQNDNTSISVAFSLIRIALFFREDKLTHNKVSNRSQTYQTIQIYKWWDFVTHNFESVVADGLVSIQCQVICNHHDEVGWPVGLGKPPPNVSIGTPKPSNHTVFYFPNSVKQHLCHVYIISMWDKSATSMLF